MPAISFPTKLVPDMLIRGASGSLILKTEEHWCLAKGHESALIFWTHLCQQGSQCRVVLIRLYPRLKRHSATPKPKRKSGADGFPKTRYLWGFVESEVLFLLNEGRVVFQEMLAGK